MNNDQRKQDHRKQAQRKFSRVAAVAAVVSTLLFLNGCAMTPRFVTAEDMLKLHRARMQAGEPLSEGAPGKESLGTQEGASWEQPGKASLEERSLEEAVSETGIPEEALSETGVSLESLSESETAGENEQPTGKTGAPGKQGATGTPGADSKDAASHMAYMDAAHYLIPGWAMTAQVNLPRPERRLSVLTARLTHLLDGYDGTWSATVRDLSSGEKLLINDGPMPSASDIKLFILGSLYEDFRTGRITRTAELVERMKNMISASSNTDANEILRILGQGDYAAGIAHVNDYIRRSGYSKDTIAYNPFQEESLILDKKHSNQTTANDTAEILERIYRRTFAPRNACAEVEQMLLNGTTRYKLPSALPEGISAGNKTGETDEVENDAMVVYTSKGDYILAVFSTGWKDKSAAQHRFKEISAEVYRYFSDEAYVDGIYPYLEKPAWQDNMLLWEGEEETLGTNRDERSDGDVK